MRLAILGGGGFRTPLVYAALLADRHDRRITDVVLYDVAPQRLSAIAAVLGQQASGHEAPPALHTTTVLDEALEGADFVFSAIRVGGLLARTADERVALDLGLLGQETTGPGGLSFALRTVPVAVHVAQRVASCAPGAWVINFTNPAGLVTEAMQAVLGERVVGICDSPAALVRRAVRLLELPDTAAADYVGLNHLGWLRALRHDGVDHLPGLIADDTLLAATEEGQLFGMEWIRTLGAIPNEYVYYYDFTREAVAGIRAAARTRGEFLLAQQRAFYQAVAATPGRALAEWDRVRLERNATYLSEARTRERDQEEVRGGGYEQVALAIMAAIARGEPAELILNVRNGTTVPGLPADAVVEVPCSVGAAGPRPHRLDPLLGAQLGLVQQVKAVDRLVIEAARTGSAALAVQAFAQHPLVDSVTSARALLAGYRARIPEVDAVFG
ncbi:MAG TPA: 6-phospho-beta-glucosidase [Dermatophilaceae bacterium]|nr:6-phospho-beta-glucosidase [Dermatophilaceae bacterium]